MENKAQPTTGGQNPANDEANKQGFNQPNTPYSETAAATAGTASKDEDAANEHFARSSTSKSFDRDQEALNLGLDDGDLDVDVPAQKN